MCFDEKSIEKFYFIIGYSDLWLQSFWHEKKSWKKGNASQERFRAGGRKRVWGGQDSAKKKHTDLVQMQKSDQKKFFKNLRKEVKKCLNFPVGKDGFPQKIKKVQKKLPRAFLRKCG